MLRARLMYNTIEKLHYDIFPSLYLYTTTKQPLSFKYFASRNRAVVVLSWRFFQHNLKKETIVRER